MKDITFEVEYASYDNSRVKVIYGSKCVANVCVWNDDITELKAVCLAIQNEIMKDILNKTPTA